MERAATQKQKKTRQLKKKLEAQNKNWLHFVASTPSVSVTLPSAISQALAAANGPTSTQGKIEVNLSSGKHNKYPWDSLATKYEVIDVLNLSHNSWSSLPDYCQLNNVRSMSLYGNDISRLSVTRSMTMLTELNLSANRLTEFPDASSLQCMPSIKKLNLRSNSITSIPASSILVLKSTYIAELILCHNKIRSLPPEIGTLTSLTNFNLSNNLLVEMPTTILNLHNLLFSPTSFNVRRNQLISPPQEIAERSGLISIMQHFLGKSDPSKLYLGTSVRMVVVGNEDAGKSTLVTQLGKAQLSADGIADAEELTFWVPDSVTALHTHVPNQLTLTRPVRDALRDAFPVKADSTKVDRDDTPLDIKENITINIHDFVGQEMYHAVSEMFFSESSLHIVAFDIVQTGTKHDCDLHVQYWVDLVQARAPGSSILVVATHGDLLSKDTLRDRLAMVQARLSTNEALRVADLKREIKGSVDTDHRAVLRKLAELRPVIHKPIAVFSAKDENSASLKLLIARISAIVTPTVSTPNPLRIVNVSLPQHYLDVKSMMNQLRTRFRHYCTIAELDEEVAVRNRAYTAPMKVPEESMLEITRNAVVYWASVGEVVWFPSEDDDGIDQEAMYRENSMNDSMQDLLAQAEENRERNRADSASFVADQDPLYGGLLANFAPLKGDVGDYEETGYASDSTESPRASFEENTIASSALTPQSGQLEQEDASRIDLSAFVFLSPVWLNKAIKGVMNKAAMASIERDRGGQTAQRRGKSRANFRSGVVYWDLVRCFLEKNPEFTASQGLVSPQEERELTLALLRGVLTRLTLIIPIDSGQSADAGAEPTTPTTPAGASSGSVADTKSVSSAHASESADPRRKDAASTEDAADVADNTCYLLPALLAEHNLTTAPHYSASDARRSTSSTSRVSFAQKGCIRLERRFTFSRFVPSAIVPRIIAKMYSKFGRILKTSAAEGSDQTTCWRSSFIQEYGDCRVWILFEEDHTAVEQTPLSPQGMKHPSTAVLSLQSPRSRLASKEFTSQSLDAELSALEDLRDGCEPEDAGMSSVFEADGGLDPIFETGMTRSFTFELDEEETEVMVGERAMTPASQSAPDADETAGGERETNAEDDTSCRVVQLRIISYGHLLHVNSVVQALDHYNEAVQQILSEYRGVSEVFPTTLCPVCLLKQLPEEQCGQFNHIDRDSLAASLLELGQREHSSPEALRAEYRAWAKHWRDLMICPRNGCIVKANFLAYVPEQISELFTPEQYSESLTDYLREEVINPSLDESHKIKHTAREALQNGVVRVIPLYEEAGNRLQAFVAGRISANDLPDFAYPPGTGKTRTGTVVSIPLTGGASTTSGANVQTAVLTALRFRSPEQRVRANTFFLVGGTAQWLYVARYINQPPLDSQAKGPVSVSDAALLELVAPITPFPINSAATTFRVRAGYEIKRCTDGSSRIDPAMLGRDLSPIPLSLVHLYRVPVLHEADATVTYYRPRTPRRRSYLEVEQVVQICGYGSFADNLPDSNWARVVHRNGEFFLASAYSEKSLAGAPVLDSRGRLVGVVSTAIYKKGAHSAFYIASLNDLECC